MPTRRSALRLAELGLLALVALWALWFQLRLPGRLPEEADYERVAEVLRSEARPGDAVLLFPWWIERARVHVPAGIPVVGYQGSEGNPLTPHPRIWVLAAPELPGNEAAAFDRAFLPQRSPLGEPRRFGNLALTLYENGRHRPRLFSLADALAQATVFLERDGGERQPCPFDGRAHRCPNQTAVAAEWHEVRFEARHCIWAPPPAKGTRLVIELPALPIAERWSLEAGYTWDRGAFHLATLAPTRLTVQSEGRNALELLLPVGVEGVQRADRDGITLGPGARLTVESDNPEYRDVCLDLFGDGALR